MVAKQIQRWTCVTENELRSLKRPGKPDRFFNSPWDYAEGGTLPYSYTGSTQAARENEFFANWPAGWTMPPIVDLQTGGADFRTNVMNTVNANGRCAIRLPAGVFHLTAFTPAAGDMYAFGLFHTNLAGFVGQGADQSIIQMDANSMSTAQLSGLATLTSANVNNLHVMRLDGDASNPAVLVGVTVRAADQQIISSFAAGNNIVGNQPAPHGGVMWYKRGSSSYGYYYCSHVNAEGAGRACTSLPPFEHANFSSQYSYGYYYHTNSDGRRAAALDAARPRRCGVVMGNNEYTHYMQNCWLHHSNVSRYAVNDQNSATSGPYTVAYSKIEQITTNQNTDPALNGGASLGGYTNATPFGWESCNSVITVHHCIISQDNTVGNSGQVPCHFQMTTVGARNPQGGRFYAYDNVYRHSQAHLNGFETRRIDDATYWYSDGLNTTIDTRVVEGGSRKTPWTYTGTRFPTSTEITTAGITPDTHYIVNLI